MKSLMIVWFLLGTGQTQQFGQEVPIEQYKQLVLDIHNRYRKLEHSSNMQELVWDNGLSGVASDWLRRCVFEHKIAGYGENLAFITNRFDIDEQIETVMEHMYNERADYLYNDQNNCGLSCHYTQIIWAETRRVGCAMVLCNTLITNSGGSYNNAWLFGCFYDPRANYCSVPCYPYHIGKPCSKCKAGQFCNDGLCSGQSVNQTVIGDVTAIIDQTGHLQGGGFNENETGVTDTNNCIDKDLVCPSWAKTGKCFVDGGWRAALCRLSCRLCQK